MYKWHVVLLSLPLLVIAQSPSCQYSCPEFDNDHRALITAPFAIPYSGPYTIFECIYQSPGTTEQSCSYSKTDGSYMIGSRNTPCPIQAPPCESWRSPKFSAQDKVETPSYIQGGNFLLYMKEHPPVN